jgi:ribosomal-protein-alanine N-acetyltransferase
MVSFDPFPILETPRLLLRRLGPGDAEALLRIQQDPQVTRFLGRDPDTSLEQILKRIELVDSNVRESAGITWALVLRETGALIGTAGLWRWVKPHRYAEIGYQLASAYWGRGLMTEALLPVLRYGFEVMEVHRIEGNTDPQNGASARVLEKLGFQQEARLRENWFYNGAFTDSVIYGLLRREFKS